MFRIIWNMADSGTAVADLMTQLRELSRAGADDATRARGGRVAQIDWVFPAGELVLQAEVSRTSVTDRTEARRLPTPDPGRHPVLIAPFLSPAVRDDLARSGWSYWDATGNVLIQSEDPFVWIDRAGANRNPSPERLAGPQRLRSLKGRAVSMVLVRLLANGRAPSVRELARLAEVGVATVSRVVELLREEDLLADTKGGPIVVSDRSRLARRWAEDYSFAGTYKAKRYYSVLGEAVALQRLRDGVLPYAITGVRAASEFLGEQGRLSSLPSSQLWLYTPDRQAAEHALDLTPDPRGSIVVGQADFVSAERGYRASSGLRYADSWRIVGDLLSTSGRTAAVGEELLDELIRSPLGVRI